MLIHIKIIFDLYQRVFFKLIYTIKGVYILREFLVSKGVQT